MRKCSPCQGRRKCSPGLPPPRFTWRVHDIALGRMTEELWSDIPGYTLAYQISSLGRVWSPGRYGKGKFLKPGVASNGYPTVALGRGNTRTLHSLVANAFLGPTPDGQEVRHKSGDRLDPSLDNLEFGTRTENIFDSLRHNLWKSDKRRAGWKQIWVTRRERYGPSGGNPCRT